MPDAEGEIDHRCEVFALSVLFHRINLPRRLDRAKHSQQTLSRLDREKASPSRPLFSPTRKLLLHLTPSAVTATAQHNCVWHFSRCAGSFSAFSLSSPFPASPVFSHWSTSVRFLFSSFFNRCFPLSQDMPLDRSSEIVPLARMKRGRKSKKDGGRFPFRVITGAPRGILSPMVSVALSCTTSKNLARLYLVLVVDRRTSKRPC